VSHSIRRTTAIPLAVLLALALCVGVLLVTLSGGAQGLANAPKVPGIVNSTSTNWSGYAVATNLKSPASNVVSDVKGGWTVPTVTPTSSDAYSSCWVGIDGYSDSTVEQIGTEQDSINGTAVYSAWFEMYPQGVTTIPYQVFPGDAMTAEVEWLSGDQFELFLNDTTSGHAWSYSATQSISGALRQSAEWIVEAPSFGTSLPLAEFGTAYFTGGRATINGVTDVIGSSDWQNDKIIMVTKNHKTQMAFPSDLTNGTDFSVVWSSSGQAGGGGSGGGHHGHSPH
jgi:hypothetical protein